MSAPSSKNSTYGLLKFVSRLPLPVMRFMAGSLAGIVNLLKTSKTSEQIRFNLKITLPELSEQERERVTRAAIRNELISYFEFFNIWGSDNKKNIQRIHRVEGEHLLKEALSADKGLVLIVPHFGTWEIMNAYIAQYTQMSIMYKPVKDPAADEFVREARSREQATLLPTDETGVRQIFKALKQGGTTVILPDHTPNVGGEYIPFFGVPLSSSNLTAKLIQKTKAKCLFLYAMRNENGDFDMFIEPLNEEIYSSTPNQGTEIIFRKMEELIHHYPEHYHWSYKRFKAHHSLGDIYHIPHDEALAKINDLRQTYQDEQAKLAAETIQTSNTTIAIES
ncbi:lipid A biosynthesis acyltransferase [Acinetobacter sp. LoGeW2-3]|uniref:lysophospholipid acyltransferase family protein n=1 Tax=Acinetobacter sp. LoGeW2-3 TaxID=1808001 RepID=UPI000C05B478|nr:lysophospholipid acyltransferase family protein [Acinetobacter sp. LoGeW2-3]ATO19900.1 lipid A biosynthesis acyltransferase [Acinetobacter sp. LoGeW2-3]